MSLRRHACRRRRRLRPRSKPPAAPQITAEETFALWLTPFNAGDTAGLAEFAKHLAPDMAKDFPSPEDQLGFLANTGGFDVKKTEESTAQKFVALVKERLAEIEHGITRVASITQALRTFARPDDAPPGAVDAAATLDQALKMVDNDIRHRAELVKRVASVPPVTGVHISTT